MALYWKHEKPRWIPEISQGFYYCQTSFVITSFKCWRGKSFLSCPAKQNLFSTQSRSTGNSWFSHNGQTRHSNFSKAHLPKEVLLSSKKATWNYNKLYSKQWICCTREANERCSVKVAFFSKVLFCSVLSRVYDQVL